MEIVKNLDKLPVKAQPALKALVMDLGCIYGDDVLSIFAYGSVTGPDYDPRTSDINVGVVLNAAPLSRLKLSIKASRRAMRRKVTAPLFLTPAYIRMSLDTFPIEFADMKDTRVVLFGQDPLAGIEIEKDDLRRECEYQLKGKLLVIRQAYAERALAPRGLENLIKTSFRALFPVLKGVLRMKADGPLPGDKESVLKALEKECGVDTSSFISVLRDKKSDGRIDGKHAEDFLGEFLAQLEKLCEMVGGM